MSDTKSTARESKPTSTALLALAAIAVVILIAVVLNYIVGALGLFNFRVDLTEDKVYTLSDGTKNILGKIPEDMPIALRYYVTEDSRTVPRPLKDYARDVEDLLLEFKKASKGRITLEKFNPEPDTDAEDSAALDGVRPQSLNMTDQIYFGVAMQSLDRKEVLPFLDPNRETLLEYDIARAISQITADSKPIVGILSPFPIAGPAMQLPPQMMGGQQQQQPWIMHSELARDYEVRTVDYASPEPIDPEVKILFVIHPANATTALQYRIDQFVMGGGKAFIFLDPHSVVAQIASPRPNPMMGQQGPPPIPQSSNLPELLKAWGLSFSGNQVLVDMNYRTPLQGGRRAAGILSLGKAALSDDDLLTSELSDVLLVFPGGFSGEAAEGLTMDVLARSSGNSQLVNPSDAEREEQKIMSSFLPSNTQFPLALRLTGTFKSAFAMNPNQAPPVEGAEAPPATAPHLTEATGEGSVVLVGDTDWAYDQFSVRVQNFMGMQMAQPINDNLSLVQNVVEQLAGDPDLIRVRSRSSSRRPFTRVNEMMTEAEAAYSAEIESLEGEFQTAQQRINDLQREKDPSQQMIITPEQQEEIEKLEETRISTSKRLREVRKDLNKDIDKLESKITLANVLGVPLIVAWIGIVLAGIRKFRTSAK